MQIVLITGAPCVGKTSVARALLWGTPRSGWIEGDAGHRINPFRGDPGSVEPQLDAVAPAAGRSGILWLSWSPAGGRRHWPDAPWAVLPIRRGNCSIP